MQFNRIIFQPIQFFLNKGTFIPSDELSICKINKSSRGQYIIKMKNLLGNNNYLRRKC